MRDKMGRLLLKVVMFIGVQLKCRVSVPVFNVWVGK